MIKFFNVDLQYQQDREVYLDLADRVYSSGQVINGKYCRKLENSLKTLTGRKHCVLTASCTDALAFVGSALQSSNNNNFIFPSISFPATDNGFARESINANRIYIPVDINGNIDLRLLKNKLKSIDTSVNTVVIWVNLFGHTVDFDQIEQLQEQYPSVRFVEDAAQSIGAYWKDTPSGSMGIAICTDAPIHPSGLITDITAKSMKLMLQWYGGNWKTDLKIGKNAELKLPTTILNI
jgi:dTDP-4-amino-4,6-dideoxygalactose transaminase